MSGGVYGSKQTNPYPQTEFLNPATKRPSTSWQQFFLNLLNFSSSTTATAGSGSLPAAPVGFINVTVNGQPYKVPYYNQ